MCILCLALKEFTCLAIEITQQSLEKTCTERHLTSSSFYHNNFVPYDNHAIKFLFFFFAPKLLTFFTSECEGISPYFFIFAEHSIN